MSNPDIERAARKLREGRVVVLTGAGLSVDSGIPDFRSAGGVWTRYSLEEYSTIEAFRADPRKVWKLFAEMSDTLTEARPNPGHDALARLESAGLVSGVITQNIDGLHQAAGSKNVVEYHGSVAQLTCLTCSNKYPNAAPASFEQVPDGPRVPLCACGAVLKPDIILFGEMIPYDAIRASRTWADQARVCLVCGTSAQVHPASAIPDRCKDAGATVIEVNLERIALTERTTDILLQGRTSDILPALVAAALSGS